MHINERGLKIRIVLYLTLLTSVLLIPSHSVIKEPEVVMEPTHKRQPIKAIEVPITKVVAQEKVAEPRYGFTEKEIYLLTVLLCGSGKRDGDGEYDFDFQKPVNAQQVYLVLNVVMNRVNSNKFPDKVSEVVWAKNQFVYMPHWKHGLPKVKPESYELVKNWCVAYDNYEKVMNIPPSHLYFSGNGKINKSSERW